MSASGVNALAVWSDDEPGACPDGVRIAVVGDVHANLAALEAVVARVRAMGIHRGVVTGDLVGRGDRPDECIELVRALGWPCVRGNTDRFGPGVRGPRSAAGAEWLARLPTRLLLRLGGVVAYATHWATRRERDLAVALGADCLVSGHTHLASVRRIRGLLLVNPGSVGEAMPDDLRPSWAWICARADRIDSGLERCAEPLARPRVPRALAASATG